MALSSVRLLDNQLLDAMLADATLRASFGSCLASITSARAAGGCKCRGAGRKPEAAYAVAKDCILGLPQPAKDQLKAALNTAQLKVIARGREYAF